MIVCNTLKSINKSNKDTIDHSIKKETSDEIAHENMMNFKENSILDFKTLRNLRRGRLESVLSERYQYNTSIERGQRFLLQHVNSNLILL
jgi:adenylate cyclase